MRKKREGDTSSRYFGVFRHRKLWGAAVQLDGQMRHLGHFCTEKEAAIAHDRVALYFEGESARLNFPDAKLSPASVDEVHPRPSYYRKGNKAKKGFAGIHRLKPGSKRWVSKLMVDGIEYALGIWATQEEAALAYDRALLHYSDPPDWKLNVPREARRAGAADAETLAREAREKYKKTTTSRFRGVWWASHSNAWLARLTVNRKIYSAGPFNDEEVAAEAYDRLALKHLGREARLNFHPDTGEELGGKRLDTSA